MVSPSSYLLFCVVNAIVWPSFAGLYWFMFQRADEDRIEAMSNAGTGAEG